MSKWDLSNFDNKEDAHVGFQQVPENRTAVDNILRLNYNNQLRLTLMADTCINCEFIGDKLIEVHLRANEDMGEYDEIIPVWKGEEINVPNGFTYIEQPNYKRVGFYKRKK